jgi:hypothetical protein
MVPVFFKIGKEGLTIYNVGLTPESKVTTVNVVIVGSEWASNLLTGT